MIRLHMCLILRQENSAKTACIISHNFLHQRCSNIVPIEPIDKHSDETNHKKDNIQNEKQSVDDMTQMHPLVFTRISTKMFMDLLNNGL